MNCHILIIRPGDSANKLTKMEKCPTENMSENVTSNVLYEFNHTSLSCFLSKHRQRLLSCQPKGTTIQDFYYELKKIKFYTYIHHFVFRLIFSEVWIIDHYL